MSDAHAYVDDGGKEWYSKRTWRHAQETKARAERVRQEKEVEHLRRLGADEKLLGLVGTKSGTKSPVD